MMEKHVILSSFEVIMMVHLIGYNFMAFCFKFMKIVGGPNATNVFKSLKICFELRCYFITFTNLNDALNREARNSPGIPGNPWNMSITISGMIFKFQKSFKID